MKYKGFIGKVEYDESGKVFHGEVLGVADTITFQGQSVKELEKAFKDSVDDYLEFCKQEGLEPQKSVSGETRLRMGEERHIKVALISEQEGKSMNEWLIEAIDQKIKQNAG
ncbi:MAG: type II toxin-antitoxin system HicB family antitoxin [Bdellovibrionales bacterium]|nr:type II toxin-antitoxin system HicB family antitoxin [Bdellovibrionales bacterium]